MNAYKRFADKLLAAKDPKSTRKYDSKRLRMISCAERQGFESALPLYAGQAFTNDFLRKMAEIR